MTEYEATVADVKASLQDELIGRLSSIHDVQSRIRKQLGRAEPTKE